MSFSLYVLKSHESFTYVSPDVFSIYHKSLIINILQDTVQVSFSAPNASQKCGAFLFVAGCRSMRLVQLAPVSSFRPGFMTRFLQEAPEASRSNYQMDNSIHIKGPFGNLSAEMLFPQGFDREKDQCEMVILMHGFLGRFDFNGYGKSEGAQIANTVPGMIQDAMAVWTYASSLPYVNRIILLGHSQGGVVAGMLAGRLEKAGTPPAALIQLAPASVLKEYASQGRFLSVHCDPVNPPDSINVYGFKMGRDYILTAQTLPIEEESAWYTGPVCLLHGTMDRIVPISCSERYHQIYQNSEFHRIRGTEHLFLFHRRKVRQLILDFIVSANTP